MIKKLFATAFIALSAIAASAQDRNIVTVTIEDKVRLSDVLDKETLMNVDSIVLKGVIRLADFNTLRDMINTGKLTGIDMSDLDCISIPDMAFMSPKVNTADVKGYRMGLRYITFPRELKQIGTRAFLMNDLRTVTLSNRLVYIGESAFGGCDKIKSVDVCSPYSPRLVMPGIIFSDVPSDAVLNVPVGSGADYSADERWSAFKIIKEKDNLFNVKHVYLDGTSLAEAFGEDLLTTDSLVITGFMADNDKKTLFEASELGRLRGVDMSGARTENDIINFSGYHRYTHIRYLRLPLQTKKIMFCLRHSYLLDFSFPPALEELGRNAFVDCRIPGDIHVPEGVKQLDDSALSNLMINGSFYLPSTVTRIGDMAIDFNFDLLVENFDFDTDIVGKPWNMYINRMTPPDYYGSASAPFKYYGYSMPSNYTLYVPVGAKEAYSNNKHWNCFKNIVETSELDGGVTGISSAVTDNKPSADTRVFTLDGRLVGTDINALPKGMYIVGGKKVVK